MPILQMKKKEAKRLTRDKQPVDINHKAGGVGVKLRKENKLSWPEVL